MDEKQTRELLIDKQLKSVGWLNVAEIEISAMDTECTD